MDTVYVDESTDHPRVRFVDENPATSLHVVFLQYIDNGTFEIVSCSRNPKIRILLDAFRSWGFKSAEYRPTGYANYVQCNEKEAMLLKLKTGK
jgi:hypothetical protein